MKKLDYIAIEGHLDLRRIFEWSYRQTSQEFRSEGIILPEQSCLQRYGNTEKLWVTLNDFNIKRYFDDGTYDEYDILKGLVYDKTTVPIFKDDKYSVAIMDLMHDVDFSLKHRSFWDTSVTFFQNLRCSRILYNGVIHKRTRANILLTLLYFCCVVCPVAYFRFRKTNRPNHEYRTIASLGNSHE